MKKPSINQQITFLYTRDLEKTSQFYENLMKLPLILDQGSCRIYQVSPDAFLGFCERESAPEQPQGIIFTFVTAQVDEWYSYLAAKGVEFEKAPTLNPDYNIYHSFLRDPNGYLLEIQQFRNPAWPAPATATGTESSDHPD
jgi:catechol 2,3-dioxygenase-like lactoylglutathione lyase family enzyme